MCDGLPDANSRQYRKCSRCWTRLHLTWSRVHDLVARAVPAAIKQLQQSRVLMTKFVLDKLHYWQVGRLPRAIDGRVAKLFCSEVLGC